ncbi:TonB-dependent siderophore receptor [Stutzerimonas kunmingensis]|uniref:TonB-dependent siderophore receptor n=1 Tax=Stutzerimonas kunmingensis TaxID=1211807 RepID=UPI0028AB472B|nr:TonB-dependent siderophore receptor [Stutzerimonas kunmingensis]
MRSSALPFIPNRSRALALGIRAALLCLSLASVVPGAAMAQSATQQVVRSYDIPAGPLSSTLSRFAGEAGVLLSVDGSLLQGMDSNGLQGQYGVDAGFAALLQGSGLQAVRDSQGNYSLARRSAQTDAVELQPMTVEGFALGNALGSMEGYNATHSSVATKTSMPLLETSQSVSVVTRQQMDDQGSLTVAQALRYTPGVMSSPYGATSRYDYVAMRGFNDGSVDNLYLDGLKVMGDAGTYSTMQIDPYFLERIDVLKGPSSVLYGRSLPGGLVAMTSKQPTAKAYRQVQATLGSNAQKSIGVDLGGPLDDDGMLSYRLVGLAEKGDTQYDHVESQRYAVAPSLRIDFSADTALTLQAYLQHDPESGYHGGLPAEGTLYRRNGRYLADGLFEGEPDHEKFERTQQMLGYQFEHRFDDTWSMRQNFRYLDSEVESEQVYGMGWNGNSSELARAYTGADERLHSWIIDNMLQAEFDTGAARHTLITGIDYQRGKSNVAYYGAAAANLDAFDPVYGAPVTPGAPFVQTRRLEQTGLYMQDLIELDRWRLSLGVRQDWVETEVETAATGTSSGKDSRQLTSRAGVLYLFDNGVAPYLSYSQSFNPNSTADASGNPLEPTEGTQWELGIKYQPVGHDDLYTASLFHIEQENLASKLPDENFFRPVGAVRFQGLELEARLQVTESLRLLGSYTFTDIEYSKSVFSAVDSTLDNKGNTPTQSVRHMASLWADYRFVDRLAGLSTGAGIRYVGKSWADAENTQRIPSYTLFDAAIGYDLANVGLPGAEVRLNANNLTDKRYVAACGSSLNYCYMGEERNVTATVSYEF